MNEISLHLSDTPSFSKSIRHRFPKRIAKRLFDLSFSLFALTGLTPLIFFIGAVIFCKSPGKIFYAQIRIGRGGRPFKCYKLRTMHTDADKRLSNLLKENPILQEEWARTQKLRRDPRILGRFGVFLRKTALDELPQFWNVLKGDLSVVGPRPMVAEEIEQRLGSRASKILSMRPGLTGIWQTTCRSVTIDYEARIAMDEHYIDRSTLLLDLKLILKTIPCMLLSKGA